MLAFLLVVLACLLPAIASAEAPQSGESASPIAVALERGEYRRLRDLAYAKDDTEALVARAKLAQLEGDLKSARRFAQTGLERATAPADAARAVEALARLEWELGETEQAEQRLREHLKDHPQAHGVRLALGELLIATGRRSEGETVLAAFSVFFNNSLLKSSRDLTLLSQAMVLLGSFDDANYAMQEAIERDPKNATALVHWGNLLLSKYNTADAEASFKEALAINAAHPEALIGLARTELELSNDYNKVRDYLEQAAKVTPEAPELLLTHAEVAIYDSDCETARQYADQVLSKRPRHLEALTIRAACAYLDDDQEAYERLERKVLGFNPQYARLLTETARYAVRVHRYEEAVALNRRALELHPEYPPALLGIGIGLSRIGKEDEAIEMLRRAFEADPYNVRAYNMVEMYERQMPDYEFTEYEGFRIRAHRSENEAINAFVAPLVREAYDAYVKKYGFRPADYLAIEIFPNTVTFSVRSVGLPHVSPHGICFGKVVVSRSPSEGNFNWKQVIWHEMAHVFHIQLSKSRVPRWFTEGLAEYETNVKNPAWARHHDRELARALNADTLRGVLELSQGFTHARSFEEILRSYHQSSLVIHYLVETHGFDALVRMLEAWGERRKTPEVLRTVLGKDAAQVDEGFRAWLSRRYMNFRRQLTVDLADLPPVSELEARTKQEPEDADAWARLAVARYREGDMTGADDAIARAVAAAPKQPGVNAIATLLYYDRGRMRDAYERGLAVLDAQQDSYDLRYLLGSAALALEDVSSAEVHFRAATTLFEDGADAWRALERVARLQKDEALRERAVRRLFELDQNDLQVAREYAELLQNKRQWSGVVAAAERWIAVNPFDPRAHRLVAQASLEAKKPARAEQAWEALLILRETDRKDILRDAVTALAKHGLRDRAQAWAKRARQAGVTEQELDRLLK